MNKLVNIFALIICVSVQLQAQSILLNFTASGAASGIDSIEVINLTQCNTKYLYSGDTLLLGNQTGLAVLPLSAEQIFVYPNPFSESVSVEFSNSVSGGIKVEVFDVVGRSVIEHSDNLPAGAYICKLSGLRKGVYTVFFSYANSYAATRVVSLNEQNPDNAQIYFEGTLKKIPAQSRKSLKAMVQMDYDTGDWIYFKAFSGNHMRVKTMVPMQSTTVDFEFVSCIDIDNNNYPVIKIGNQYWMGENLEVTKYQNGDSIPTGLSNHVWTTTTQGAYDVYPYSDVDGINSYTEMLAEYGALYNWYAVIDSRGICPAGWHVPSDAEWSIFSDFLGGLTDAGGKLKIKCSKHWEDPNTDANNETGFRALPGGYKWQQNGLYYEVHQAAYFWTSSTENCPVTDSWRRRLKYDEGNLNRYHAYLRNGFSIRCVKN